MKRLMVLILTLVMAVTAVCAFAEDTQTDTVTSATQQQGETPAQGKGRGMGGQNGGMQRGGRQRGNMPGNAQTDGTQPDSTQPDGTQPNGVQRGNGQAGGRGLRNRQFARGGKAAIDFDAMVTQGVISQETRDKIAAYLQGNQKNGGMRRGFADCLDMLLKADVITREEYDALKAASMPATANVPADTGAAEEKPE